MIAKNKLGGIDESEKHLLERAKEADLITLPKSVEGTNCFNCEYVTNKTKEKGFCSHKKVLQLVNDRMCCAYWNNPGVYRAFGKESSKFK